LFGTIGVFNNGGTFVSELPTTRKIEPAITASSRSAPYYAPISKSCVFQKSKVVNNRNQTSIPEPGIVYGESHAFTSVAFASRKICF
jgi:hypothetical protein